jgi:hypothetical protein
MLLGAMRDGDEEAERGRRCAPMEGARPSGTEYPGAVRKRGKTTERHRCAQRQERAWSPLTGASSQLTAGGFRCPSGPARQRVRALP